jgi:type IV pilus assembly protein PilQ
MPFFQFEIKNPRFLLVIAALALFLVAGCVTQSTEQVNTSEKNKSKVAVLDESSVSKEDVSMQKSIPGQKRILGIEVKKENKIVEIQIQGDQKLTYTSIKQPFPFAICLYLPETSIEPGLIPGQIPADIESETLGGLKVSYADEKKTTAKIQILLNRDISYEVKEDGEQLRVILSTGQLGDIGSDQVPSKEITMVSEDDMAKEKTMSEPVIVPDTPAEMTNIEFNTATSGKSDIRVDTSHPIKYDITRKTDKVLNLNLYNTKIPAIHQRPLLTQYFNSAVERIEPKTMPDKPEDSRIEINIRDQVPYQIVQDQKTIRLVFEPSRVEPPVFNKAQKKLASGIVETKDRATMTSAGNGMEKNNPEKKESENLIPGQSLPRYTGEKIKLDFYETDIKNVFRILRSVSGLNFAIDKDVQGKVTMTLENPVPWDQVLDLALKMNGLGKKEEGNVIRIATNETLKHEEQILQDALAAKKKSLEQKKSFEPLVTEYIPINYSDAKADISPHLEQILSKDRGTLSVDQRTNMIIITDTQAKIDQAQEIIYRLDTVTPQIMIEAKVVEVTKEFSRSFGIGWNLSNAVGTTSGFVDDFNVSVNQPSGSGVNMDFSFFRLFGSSVAALNAQLEASEEQGEVRIVSSPRILTLDNKKARIKQGLEFAYLERDDAGGSSIKFKDIDLLLEVTPHVTPDKRISMTLFLTKNDIAGVTATGVPTLATNEAETELLVNNNDTVVIGGVVKTTNNKNNSGLPFLSGIPILGSLFGTDTKVDNRNELLIFLTPSIVQLEQKRHVKTSASQ